MKYLNVGCGSHFSKEKIWTNLDFKKTGEEVISHNLLQGIPFLENSFDAVYHSHVLEHFSKQDGTNFLKECHRVLNSTGVLRIAIPDLERIVKSYLKLLNEGLKNPDNEMVRANYNWILLEMFDQTVRNSSGGEMKNYLFQDKIINEEFIYQRIGEEGKSIRNNYLNKKLNYLQKKTKVKGKLKAIINRAKHHTGNYKKSNKFEKIGKFRLQGQIHQWMYDRYSLSYILKQIGFEHITVVDAFNSSIPNWEQFNIDGSNNIVRKPDSLFIEAIKA